MAAERKKKAPSTAPAPVASVRISEPLRVRAKVYATINRISLQDVLDAAVDDYLKKRGA